jgi:hypothetical protein
MSETAVTSFIIRFTQEPAPDPAPWRGLIRHIQTDQEAHFARIEDALQFIAQFIEISDWPLENDLPS